MSENTPRIAEAARGLALILTDAIRHDLPNPTRVTLDEHAGVDLHVGTIGALRQWAEWADAPITEGEPSEYLPGRWAVTHKASGTIYDLPVTLACCEFGVMVEADYYDCKACGAQFGSSAGFVADGTYDDWFECELTRHMDGECVRVGASA